MKIFDVNLSKFGQIDDESVGIRQDLEIGQIANLVKNTQIDVKLSKNAKIW